MATNQFQTNSAQLQQAAKNMMSTNAELQANLSQLAQEVETVQAGWAGSASNAFQILMQQFNADAKTLNNSLLQIAETVDTNAKDYQAQENQAQQSISAIANALNG